MNLSRNPQAATRAYLYAHGRIWEAFRDLWAAYQVDTGLDLDRDLPTWEDLTFAQQAAFVHKFLPHMQALPLMTREALR